MNRSHAGCSKTKFVYFRDGRKHPLSCISWVQPKSGYSNPTDVWFSDSNRFHKLKILINLWVDDFEHSSYFLDGPCENLVFDLKYIQQNYTNIHFSVQKTEIMNVYAEVNFKSLSQEAYSYFCVSPHRYKTPNIFQFILLKFKMYMEHLETTLRQGWAKSVRTRVASTSTLLVHRTSGRCGDKTVKSENTKRNIAIFYYSHSSHELFAQLPWHRRWDFIIFPLSAMCSYNNVNLISPDSWLCFVHVSGIKLFSPAKPTKYLKAINNQ